MPYFSKKNYERSLKNNLERQIYEIIKSNNRKIIEDDKLKDFEANIMKQIQIAHDMNPRCRRIHCYFENSYSKNGDRIFYGPDSISFSIYKAK